MVGGPKRKDLYRILPWRRPELENKDRIVKMLQDCKTYSGEPLDKMTIRTFCKYYRVAYEAYRDWDTEDDFSDPKDDVEFYRKRHFHKIPNELDLDSEDDFQKFDHDHYDELGFSRTNVLADDYTVPGKWVIRVSVSYSSQIWDGMKVAFALYEAGAPLHIDHAERLLAAVEETDYVRLTSYTFHNYLNWQEETSVYSLPWEYQCDYKDYDGYVGTFHYSEFAKNGYRPYLNGSKIQQVYETWSEAITAGLLELIERRKNDI